MKYEVFFYGSVIVESDNEENALSSATEHLNDNVKDFIEIREVE